MGMLTRTARRHLGRVSSVARVSPTTSRLTGWRWQLLGWMGPGWSWGSGWAEGWMGWQSRGRPAWFVRRFECDESTGQGKTHGGVVHNGGGDDDGGVGRAHGDGGSAAGDGDTGGGEDGDGGHVVIRV